MPKRARAVATGASKPSDGSGEAREPKATSAAPAWFEALYSGAMSDEYKRYMSEEWAHEKRGDVPLFEKLSLEGAQAGLSWSTILAKREGYRKAFHAFDIDKCAAMGASDVSRLIAAETATIVRHRGKIESIINNAKCVQRLIADMEAEKRPRPAHGYFDAFLWDFVGGSPTLNSWPDKRAIPSESDTANEMSKALKARGFSFVGPKICYSLMQSCGLIIDHPKGTPEWTAAKLRLANRAQQEELPSQKASKKGKRK